jgi:hypothetical protein
VFAGAQLAHGWPRRQTAGENVSIQVELSMAYHKLSLPPGLPSDLEELVREQLEPQLVDAHAMLRMPIAGDAGLQGGCNLAVVQTLLSLISGASVALYKPAGLHRSSGSRKYFKDILKDHYPWNQERHIATARLDADAAEQLYLLFRNPLAHTLGVIDPRHIPAGQRVIIEKGSIPETAIESDERSTTRPADWEHPTLRQEAAGDLVLWVRSFYWGVRKMIENVASARAQSKNPPLHILPPTNLTPRST